MKRLISDRQATIAAVADGTVDLLATDHAPHTMEEKELGFLDAPNGIIGLECAYGVCHKVLVDGGFISDERLIELMSTGPAELMGHDKTDITAVLDDYADAVPGDDDNPTQQIYVEAYEEYISHYDPLNEFEGNYIYDGLEWGLNGEYLGWNLVIQGEDETWCNIYYNGAEATQHIISKAGQSTMNLNEKPRSAAEYCYNKNKRNDLSLIHI
mgnify:CR=1 FL=1